MKNSLIGALQLVIQKFSYEKITNWDVVDYRCKNGHPHQFERFCKKK
jgi:hypothetical protein